MTREEAIKGLISLVEVRRKYVGMQTMKEEIECLDMAIKALEKEPKYCDRNICIRNEHNGIGCGECEVTKSQEPCGDYISRAAVDDAIYDYSRACDVNYAQIMEYIDKLPSVKPQEQKTGHWIPVSERLPEMCTYTLWCASSGYVRSDYFNGEFWEDAKKYCYEVIAWMPLPKPYNAESEDKE